MPPGADFPKKPSVALEHPEGTALGSDFGDARLAHPGASGFRIIPVGADGFLVRMQMIAAAERTIDLQYYIFRGDDTGRLLTGAVLKAADRHVRIRILIDDGETTDGDEQLTALEAHPSIELRIFNPFVYRGHLTAVRAAEFAIDGSRLDYRMHNKLLVVDNAIALIGGRNIGDQYFQIDPQSQFADDDVFALGPVVPQLSATFDEFWNSTLAIPAEALGGGRRSRASLDLHRRVLKDESRELKAEGADYVKRVQTGEPFGALMAGRLPLLWAPAQVISDSPDKKQVANGTMIGRLMRREVAQATREVQAELLMITPYLIPGSGGMKLLTDLRRRDVRVRILTSSLESSTELVAQSGYMHYRVPLLQSGVELFEIRSRLGNTRGSGQTAAISRYGNYSLHAKMFVFDRKRVFIGSMNFDQRSLHLNTEIGLLIDSPELAGQIATRFEAMIEPVNAYRLELSDGGARAGPRLLWRTREQSEDVEYTIEPARSDWERFEVDLMSLLPLDREL